MTRTIDLNCDLGERDDAEGHALDLRLLDIVTSANIACGGHAGDDRSVERTVRAALSRHVAIGAHPSYPDRARFGRTEIAIATPALEESLVEQIQLVLSIAHANGGRVQHVKPHGALYHAAMNQREIGDAVARAVSRCDRSLVLVGLAEAAGLARWRAAGFEVAAEAFADRRYEDDGSLRARTKDGALIDRPEDAAAQAVAIAREGCVVSANGNRVRVPARTICLHSDTPGAAECASVVRTRIEEAGIVVRALHANII